MLRFVEQMRSDERHRHQRLRRVFVGRFPKPFGRVVDKIGGEQTEERGESRIHGADATPTRGTSASSPSVDGRGLPCETKDLWMTLDSPTRSEPCSCERAGSPVGTYRFNRILANLNCLSSPGGR